MIFLSILPVLALCTLNNRMEASQAADYFPLEPGSRWVYLEQNGGLGEEYEDRAGVAVTLGTNLCNPVSTYSHNKLLASVYYRVEADTVYLAGFDLKRPLPNPYPILKVGPGKTSWKYSGGTQFYSGPATLDLKGESHAIKDMEWSGKKVPALQVHLEAIITGMDGVVIKSNQVGIYAKGIGLVELRDSGSIGKERSVRSRKLIFYEAGKSSKG